MSENVDRLTTQLQETGKIQLMGVPMPGCTLALLIEIADNIGLRPDQVEVYGMGELKVVEAGAMDSSDGLGAAIDKAKIEAEDYELHGRYGLDAAEGEGR